MKNIFVFLFIVILFSCGNGEIKTQYEDYKAALKKDQDNLQLHYDYLKFLFLDAKYYDETLSYYEENMSLFRDSSESNSIYGAALCAKGGETEKIEEKLTLLKKGMLVLDDLVENARDFYPYVWRIQTYSKFPEVMNVRSIIEADIEQVYKNYEMPLDAHAYVLDAQLNVAKEYGDNNLLNITVDQIRDTLPQDRQGSLLEKVKEIRKVLGR